MAPAVLSWEKDGGEEGRKREGRGGEKEEEKELRLIERDERIKSKDKTATRQEDTL
jgi:hypothetical protein